MATVALQAGFHEETKKVSNLTSDVAKTKDGWNRGDNLKVPGATSVSEIYADLSTVIAAYGELIQADTAEFDKFGVAIAVRDGEDAQPCEVS